MEEISPKKRNYNKLVYISVFILVSIVTFVKFRPTPPPPTPAPQQLTINLTLEQLKQFDGTDTNKPIYIAFEGYIYDVSSGRSFYEPNGTYHWLTGKDATSDLHIAGGDIIKRKYQIVGKIVQ